MKNVYEDNNITLRNMRMIQFDPGHDVPALIELLANRPNMLDIQDRTLISRAIAFVNARKESSTSVIVGMSNLTVLTAMLLFMFGKPDKKRRIRSLPLDSGVADTPLTNDLLALLSEQNVCPDLSSLIAASQGEKDFLIALLPSSKADDIRTVIDLLIAGRPGVLLIKDYGMLAQTGHLEYCRERGLRIVQLTDGSAELWNLNF